MEGNAKTKLGIHTLIRKVVFYRLVGVQFAGPPCALVRALGSFIEGRNPEFRKDLMQAWPGTFRPECIC